MDGIMSGRAPFIRAILNSPDDDLPRLVFADWLDEHGDPARAEFIRLQIEFSRIVQRRRARISLFDGGDYAVKDPAFAADARRLEVQWCSLLHRHNAEWVNAWDTGVSGLRYWRGFVDRVNTTIDSFVSDIFRWLEHEPLTVFSLFARSMNHRQLAGCPGLLAVRTLQLNCPSDEVEFAIEALAESELSRNLEELILPNGPMPAHSARLLMTSPNLISLRIVSPFTWNERLMNQMNWWANRSFRSRFGRQNFE